MAIIDRIKFDGLPGRHWLVYKYPGEQFVTLSQLIVGEGQVAIFVKGGKACDCFTPGTYTLFTNNLPILKAFVNIPFGGQTPFSAEVYYINTAAMLDLNWGTVDPIQVIDPKYFIKLRVRGFGQIGLRVSKYRLFLFELIGTMGSGAVVSYDRVMDFFKGMMNTKIKTIIADAIINKDISALEISAKLDVFSEYAKQELDKEFGKFGLDVVNFFVASINFPDEDFDAINNVLKDKAAFELMGDRRYSSKRSFDVMETMAGNEGNAGGFMGAGLGFGVGMAAMPGVTRSMNSIISATSLDTTPSSGASITVKCSGCGKDLIAGASFCHECGKKAEAERSCPKCQCVVGSGQKFCHKCGAEIK